MVHAPLESLVQEQGGCELEGEGVLHPEVARRLSCDARVETVVEDKQGRLKVGRATREPPSWMLRQLRYRDSGCRFPGCGTRRFAQAHHIVWWGKGGRTELDNLLLVCSFHHKLVHELGWGIRREEAGEITWVTPEGIPYRAGPGPPEQEIVEEPCPFGDRLPEEAPPFSKHDRHEQAASNHA